MTFLITGGQGNLGWEIARAASSLPETRVVTLGRSAAPDDRELPANLQHEVGDILHPDRVREVLEQHQVTHLVHAAGARTSACEQSPLAGFEANVMGSDAVFRAAREVPTIQSVVFISTAAVYGRTTGVVDESQPLAPGNAYATTKAAAELSALGHAETAGFDLAIVRPGFVICESGGSKLHEWVRQARSGDPFEVRFIERSFVHWGAEVARSVVALAQQRARGTFHPAGVCAEIGELADLLRAISKGQEIRATVDASLRLPGNLSFQSLEQTLGNEFGDVSGLEAIIRRLRRGEKG